MSTSTEIPTPRTEFVAKKWSPKTIRIEESCCAAEFARLAIALERELAVCEEALRAVGNWQQPVPITEFCATTLRRLAEMRERSGK